MLRIVECRIKKNLDLNNAIQLTKSVKLGSSHPLGFLLCRVASSAPLYSRSQPAADHDPRVQVSREAFEGMMCQTHSTSAGCKAPPALRKPPTHQTGTSTTWPPCWAGLPEKGWQIYVCCSVLCVASEAQWKSCWSQAALDLNPGSLLCELSQ